MVGPTRPNLVVTLTFGRNSRVLRPRSENDIPADRGHSWRLHFAGTDCTQGTLKIYTGSSLYDRIADPSALMQRLFKRDRFQKRSVLVLDLDLPDAPLFTLIDALGPKLPCALLCDRESGFQRGVL